MIADVVMVDDNEIDQYVLCRIIDRSDQVRSTISLTLATDALDVVKQPTDRMST